MDDEGIVRGEELAQMPAFDCVGAAAEAVFQAIFVARRRAAFAAGGELNVKIRSRGGGCGDLNVGIRICLRLQRELNVEILIDQAHEREECVGALDHGARNAGRGAAGGAHWQERRAAGEAADLAAVDEE